MKLKLLFVVSIIITISWNAMAQVGINTIEPTADLEIVADASPMTGKYNGVILPRVITLPTSGDATFPTSDQRGLMLYLDTADSTKGFYMFDGTNYVKMENAAPTSAFLNNGTPDVAITATSDIEREGNVSIGSSLNSGKLNVEIESTDPVATRIGLKVLNSNNSSTATASSSIDLENASETTGEKIGVKNVVTGSGAGTHIGIDNQVNDASGVTTNYGIRSDVGSTSNATSTAYGIYSEIGSASSRGTNYAIYAYSQHDDVSSGSTDAIGSYSGYFRGDNFAIRNEADSDGYRMPTISGTAGQVLTTDGAGVASWQPVAFTEVDGNANNEGILTVATGGANDSQIVSTNGSNSTNVIIAGGNNISVIETGSTITITNSFEPNFIEVYNQDDGIGNGQVAGGNSTTIISNLNAFEPIMNISYTPKYSNSYLIIEADFDYDIDNGARGTDGFRSNIEVNGIEIAQKRQRFTDDGASGGGNRSSNLTPIMGKYENNNTTTLTLEVNLERWFGDDPIKAEFHRLIKITEVPK